MFDKANWLDTKVAEVLESIPLIHVHGNLGPLPWQQGGTAGSIYGQVLTLDAVRRAADGIKIIHEANGSTPEFVAAQKAINEARYVFFLGFGYHKANMERLGISRSNRPQRFTGTSYDLTPAQKGQLEKAYGKLGLCGIKEFKISQFLVNSDDYLVASDGG